jgi:SRSO17 transposase
VGGLTPAELATIGGRLEAFADDVFASLGRSDQRARGQCYLRGLMLEGHCKSIEPMAARLGEVHHQAVLGAIETRVPCRVPLHSAARAARPR